jgi:hypothetical protein
MFSKAFDGKTGEDVDVAFQLVFDDGRRAAGLCRAAGILDLVHVLSEVSGNVSPGFYMKKIRSQLVSSVDGFLSVTLAFRSGRDGMTVAGPDSGHRMTLVLSLGHGADAEGFINSYRMTSEFLRNFDRVDSGNHFLVFHNPRRRSWRVI